MVTISTNNKGFTLIEMLVATALFLTAMLIVSDIFLRATVSQEKNLAGQKAMSDLQNNLFQVSELIRTSKIEYPLGNAFPQQSIRLIRSNGERVTVRFSADDFPYCTPPSTRCIVIQEGTNQYVLTSNEVNIERLGFFISPRTSPYNDAVTAPLEQPRVTIILAGSSIERNEENSKKINLQTTVSSRIYEK
jgi:prepilin-type N-terminal cleavage/methylation domain-containing protein